MHPSEGPPVWSGAITWRATRTAKNFLIGASMIISDKSAERFIVYPIFNPDPETGLSTINRLAQTSVDPTTRVSQENWNQKVTKDRFAPTFKIWISAG